MIKQGERIEFPQYLHKRVAELLSNGLALAYMNEGKVKPLEDKKIHDILSDFRGEKRVFNVIADEDLFDELTSKIKKGVHDGTFFN